MYIVRFGQGLMQAHVEKIRKPQSRLYNCIEGELQSQRECTVLAGKH